MLAILLTGFAGNAAEVAISGALSGAFSLLRKPIEGARLAERVATILEARRAEGQRIDRSALMRPARAGSGRLS
jgi:FixJ family two-component response regulator